MSGDLIERIFDAIFEHGAADVEEKRGDSHFGYLTKDDIQGLAEAIASTDLIATLKAREADLVEALRRARSDIEAMPYSNKGLHLVPARIAAIARIDATLSRTEGQG